MMNRPVLAPRIFTACLVAALALPAAVAQNAPAAARPAAPARAAAPARPAAQPGDAAPRVRNDKEVADTQHQLIELLRLSPTLTTVVAHDPSLLANQDYVSRNNPQLAAFLGDHPEVARNPDFYLFTHVNRNDGSPDEALERAVWPEVYRTQMPESAMHEIAHDLGPMLAFACFLGALIWGIKLFVDSRRWSRIFKLQSEVHGRLIDKFGTTQELAAYMDTEAGRRFLEAAPITLDAAPAQRIPNAVSRVLLPLQIGTVLILLGVGFLSLRHVGAEYEAPMRVLGTLILMPGVGFVLSAGLTWLLASRMGLMPHAPEGTWDANSDVTKR